MESFRIWLLIVVSLVSGCASIDPLERYQDTGPATVLPQTSYHTDVVAHDGTVLRATVFQPALEPGVTTLALTLLALGAAPVAKYYGRRYGVKRSSVR
ncbi:hypothetical protein FDP08_00875 [Marinobacter panjinensis]|uniref:Uncharacterized protein n=1 Tax=Marinobacter panjinensis TaxID=2576384 RepID=A0A4U6R1U4_9GAMM|nr:hypothetical protein [Marinobacter panjinensis]MCR8915489.1 hypothetical protein [Marinobacter panjinensis]TKV66742.1 hypothetical protein FDP08_00875 [Marinobacter panjinensis]